MIAHWLFQNQSANLILFCNGWGMDHKPVAMLASGGYDVLVLSDYTAFELPVDIEGLSTRYQSIHLICWSFGVWAGQQLFADRSTKFVTRIAINGTLRPIDDCHGISVQFFEATKEHFSESVLDRFYRRMCRPDRVLEQFLENRPKRRVVNIGIELERLAGLVDNTNETDSIFDAAIVARRDMIVPTAHQIAFWNEQCSIIEIDGCHYPFTGWSSWSDIIELLD